VLVVSSCYLSGSGAAGQTCTITDNKSNTWTSLFAEPKNGSYHAYVFASWCVVTTGAGAAGFTVTATLGGSSTSGEMAISFDEFSVAAGAAPTAGTPQATNYGANTSTMTSPNISWTSNALLYGAVYAYFSSGSPTCSNSNGFTVGYQTSTYATVLAAEYQLNLAASSSPLPVIFTWSAAGQYAIGGVAFLENAPSAGLVGPTSCVHPRPPIPWR
jgi:hypothetical protein